MSKPLDPGRRASILREAKVLFAREGYDATSMTRIAEAAKVPVGSLYTYFDGKSALMESIVEEGWGEFAASLEKGIGRAGTAAARLDFLVREALPSLFVDVDLITILVSEAGRGARLGEKLDRLASLLEAALPLRSSDALRIRVGIAVLLLGSLETVRLASRAPLGIRQDEVTDFVGLIAGDLLR